MKYQIVALGALAAVSFLSTALAGTPASPPANVHAPTLHTSMTTQQTLALWQAAQTRLKADHLYSGPVNGHRNNQTIDAIRIFQSRHGLPQTGALDHATRQALGI